MLPRCPGLAWLNRSYLVGTVVGWLAPMVQSWVWAWVRAERRYRLLSRPWSAAGSSSTAARGSSCSGAAGAARSTRSSSLAAHCSCRRAAAAIKQQQSSYIWKAACSRSSSINNSSGQRAPYTVHFKLKIVVPKKGNAQKHKKKLKNGSILGSL